ncbi:MAG: GAF domain-containing sensor histidine kinase [Patescibacteria group bacterium]|nr:GAF domain-containing sensor histidine kinase [Patescibacteria group bacterium]
MGLQTILGPGYLWWSIATWVPLGTAAINIFWKTRAVGRLQRIQMNYFWAAFTLFGLMVCIPDVIIPLVWHDTRYFYVSPVSNFIFSGTVAYIILRHRFLDVRRIIAEVLTQLLFTVVLGVLYILIAFGVGIYFFPEDVNPRYILVTVLLALVVRTAAQIYEYPIKKNVQRMFFKGTYDREEVLQKVSAIVTQTLSLPDLARSLARYLSKLFDTYNASIIIRSKKEKNIFTVYSLEPTRKVIHTSKDFENILVKTTSKFVVTEELPDENPVKKFFKDRKVELSSPLYVRGEQVGYLSMYERKQNEIYTNYDLKTIEILSPHVAVALQNVLHLEEIKQFNTRLKKTVASATEDLRKANADLQQLDHLKDEFISMASHELRTPTTVIKSFLWILLHKNKEITGDAKKLIERIYQLANHMGNLIKDMLDVSILESGKMNISPEVFDITEIIKDAMEEMRMFTSAKREITFSSNSKYLVYADKDKTHQVLGNLLTNAIKYTKENGRITVSVASKNNMIAVMVADNGMGIKKNDINKLFTKFGKLHSIRSSEGQIPGSGLGLYITKKIVELSSGKLTVESNYGKGSTFTFTLPKPPKE